MPICELYCCSQECSPIRSCHVTSNMLGLSQTHRLTNQVADLLVNNLLGLSLVRVLTNQLLDLHECNFMHTAQPQVLHKHWNNLHIGMTPDSSSLVKGLARQTIPFSGLRKFPGTIPFLPFSSLAIYQYISCIQTISTVIH